MPAGSRGAGREARGLYPHSFRQQLRVRHRPAGLRLRRRRGCLDEYAKRGPGSHLFPGGHGGRGGHHPAGLLSLASRCLPGFALAPHYG